MTPDSQTADRISSQARMPRPEDEHKESPWSKSWAFLLAFLCILSLAGFGFWGRLRMLEDENTKLEKKLNEEETVHEQEEKHLRTRLRQKNRLFHNLRQEMAVTRDHFVDLNSSLRNARSDFAALKSSMASEVGRVKAHYNEELEKASEWPGKYLQECFRVSLPRGYEYAEEGQVLFPHDIASDTSGLHSLLKANDSFSSVYDTTMQAEAAGLFTRPTYPWAQYTWLTSMIERPHVLGNFTEWGVGGGGSLIFLASLARLRVASAAGFDSWKTAEDSATQQERFAESAKKCGISVPAQAELFDLSSPGLAWPEAGSQEQLAFSHIDSDDYDTTMNILKTVYPMTVEGGILAIDNFFHSSGGSKKAVQDYFKAHAPAAPIIYPVFPGLSVMIIKGNFADDTSRPNVLDGNYYSFKYIKGQPELFQSVNSSMTLLSSVHQRVKNDPQSNQMSICWLSLALQNAKQLRDFILSAEEHAEDFEVTDIFRFLSDSIQFIGQGKVA